VAEPTAEHYEEANRIAFGARVDLVAHALAAAEARGFERGRQSVVIHPTAARLLAATEAECRDTEETPLMDRQVHLSERLVCELIWEEAGYPRLTDKEPR